MQDDLRRCGCQQNATVRHTQAVHAPVGALDGMVTQHRIPFRLVLGQLYRQTSGQQVPDTLPGHTLHRRLPLQGVERRNRDATIHDAVHQIECHLNRFVPALAVVTASDSRSVGRRGRVALTTTHLQNRMAL